MHFLRSLTLLLYLIIFQGVVSLPTPPSPNTPAGPPKPASGNPAAAQPNTQPGPAEPAKPAGSKPLTQPLDPDNAGGTLWSVVPPEEGQFSKHQTQGQVAGSARYLSKNFRGKKPNEKFITGAIYVRADIIAPRYAY